MLGLRVCNRTEADTEPDTDAETEGVCTCMRGSGDRTVGGGVGVERESVCDVCAETMDNGGTAAETGTETGIEGDGKSRVFAAAAVCAERARVAAAETEAETAKADAGGG